MKIAVISPVAWRTPPRKYGPWEQVAYNVAEGLAEKGLDVTVFATGDSFGKANYRSIVQTGYEEDPAADPKVAEYSHIGFAMEAAGEFDLIHNHFDFMPLTYSRLISTPIVTTIHGFSSPKIIPIYQRYNDICRYVSISDSDRDGRLEYMATVYNGLDTGQFTFNSDPEDYLLYFSRIHHHKGAWEAIQIAKKAGRPLVMAGLIQDKDYFEEKIKPLIDGESVRYLGNAEPGLRNQLLGNAYALLHPINFEEPFGLSVAEAMLCGTPVIAFNRGAMPELIVDGKTGFLVHTVGEAAEAVRQIGSLHRADCRAHAAANFSREKMVEDYLAVYLRILEE